MIWAKKNIHETRSSKQQSTKEPFQKKMDVRWKHPMFFSMQKKMRPFLLGWFLYTTQSPKKTHPLWWFSKASRPWLWILGSVVTQACHLGWQTLKRIRVKQRWMAPTGFQPENHRLKVAKKNCRTWCQFFRRCCVVAPENWWKTIRLPFGV